MTNQENNPNVPRHIGLILDGNRRWARAQGKPTLEGHKRGYEILKDVADRFVERGVKYVSAYVFSTENWKRSQEEVSYLMDLALVIATKEVKALNQKNIRVRYLGTEDNLSPKLIKAIKRAEELTKDNTRGTLALCFNYGGQLEIADAVKKIMQEGIAPEDVTPQTIEDHLYAPDIPPVDIIVRTSGEQRLSNFMLWRASYSELMFVEKNWPEFTEEDVDLIIEEYFRRNRRIGA